MTANNKITIKTVRQFTDEFLSNVSDIAYDEGIVFFGNLSEFLESFINLKKDSITRHIQEWPCMFGIDEDCQIVIVTDLNGNVVVSLDTEEFEW